MASASEQFAASMNLGAFAKATELKKRIWFTLSGLVVYRLGTWIPIPGVDPQALAEIFKHSGGGILGMFDMFAGGALSRMSIFALNIMPYISASIIIQLMSSVVPALDVLKKEGEVGRKKMNQYTRYLTVFIAIFQAYGVAVGLEGVDGKSGASAVYDPGTFFRLSTVISLVGGTVLSMWLGEQINVRGIGQGTSLVIFAGIVAGLPRAVANTLELGRTGAMSAPLIMILAILSVGIIALIVFIERAHRRIIVQYPKRQVGNKMYGGDASHLPLKINSSGVIPPIFASSLLMMPMTVANFFAGGNGPEWLGTLTILMGRGKPLQLTFYLCLIVFFSFFYTAIVFNPADTAENLKKNGGFVPGIRPGKNTSEYFDFVLTRLTVLGASYLAALSILPEILISHFSVPFYFGGTSLLIVVTVTMDMVGQIQSHLLAHQYEGLIKKSKLRGKRG